MASLSFPKKFLLLRRTLWGALKSQLPSISSIRGSYMSSPSSSSMYDCVRQPSSYSSKLFVFNPSSSFCSHTSVNEGSQGPATMDYRSLLEEDEYHRLANSTIHDLLEKLEEYGDLVDIDGFDVDYGNEVLTLKLGSLGTYVINKQTPNRQIWISSPVSGPARFDWDRTSESWIYRRTKAKLNQVLETELEKLCGMPIKLS